MWPKVFKSLCLKESWVIFFILGIVMMNYPFINIFNKPGMLFGIPLLFLYFTLGWMISIFVIYIFTKANDFCERDTKGKGEHR